MGYLTEGLAQAVRLLATGNPDTYSAILTTVKVSSLSIGFLLGYFDFTGKRQIRAVFDTLLAFPTVLVGLIVYAMISQRGPLGDFGLLFTIPGIAIAQTVLVTPIVVSLTATAIEGLDRRFRMTVHTLGARGSQAALASLREVRSAVLAAAVTAYGRAISEVGISMMIGGNIKWHTRTITTAIALETGKGDFAVGIALGIVLLTFALVVNSSLTLLKKRS